MGRGTKADVTPEREKALKAAWRPKSGRLHTKVLVISGTALERTEVIQYVVQHRVGEVADDERGSGVA